MFNLANLQWKPHGDKIGILTNAMKFISSEAAWCFCQFLRELSPKDKPRKKAPGQKINIIWISACIYCTFRVRILVTRSRWNGFPREFFLLPSEGVSEDYILCKINFPEELCVMIIGNSHFFHSLFHLFVTFVVQHPLYWGLSFILRHPLRRGIWKSRSGFIILIINCL